MPSFGWVGGGGGRRIKKPALWTSENLNLNSEREPLMAPVNAISMTTVTCLREFPCTPQSCQHHHDDTSTSEISELHLQVPTAECIVNLVNKISSNSWGRILLKRVQIFGTDENMCIWFLSVFILSTTLKRDLNICKMPRL